MTKTYYNGQFVFQFSVVIKSKDHQDCLFVSKKLKEYFSAWDFCCEQQKEYKSARKGDLLTRELMAKVQGYASEIITFKEGLRCICFHNDLH